MKSSLAGRDLVSIADLSQAEIERVLAGAKNLLEKPRPDLLKGKILASCFFEPSTRTRLSFEAAMHRLGGAVIGFADGGVTSAKKGEDLSDTMRVVGNYADIVVIRHPEVGSARVAAEATDTPVINGGDGAHEHPTQTLIDLFAIEACQGKINGLQIAIAGDLKYGRTVHSLVLALARYKVRLLFVSPESLGLPDAIAHELKQKAIPFSVYTSLEEVIPQADILYLSRIQKERFGEMSFANPCILRKKELERAKPHLRILHALPRVDEIERSIDKTAHAYYFQQAGYAVPVRMALLALLLGKICD